MTISGAADPNHPTKPSQPSLVVLRRDISAVLRSARAESGCSQREFAERCGCSQSTIARLEADRGDPALSCLTHILDRAGTSLMVVDPAYPTRMQGEYARDLADRRLPAHLEPYRLRAPHSWWPGITDILMWGNEPKWSYRRYPPQ
jgi:transcriptional regulator with XRE-family HTH domain